HAAAVEVVHRGAIDAWIEDPALCARLRVEGEDAVERRAEVERAVVEHGRCLEGGAELARRVEVAGAEAPCDREVAHVLARDLAERREARTARSEEHTSE